MYFHYCDALIYLYYLGGFIFYIYAFSRRFYQSNLQYIQVIHVLCVPWELNPQPFALLTQCSTTDPQEHIKNMIFF